MSLRFEISKAFSLSKDLLIEDSFIEGHQDLMELSVEDHLMVYVPSYMLWCLKNKDSKLVDLNTVHALSEYGRSKSPDGFRSLCSAEQREVIYKFLVWCSEEIDTADAVQIERSLKKWSS
jgi:hypothetical protein